MSAQVQVDAVAHGGHVVVIRLGPFVDLDDAKQAAAEIRDKQLVDLRDPRWAR